jgi:predicted RNA-binding Zn ribbon-like protein
MIEQDWLCLELLKTRGWESRDRDDDVLDSGLRFLAWARKQGLLTPSEANLLRMAAGGKIAPWFDTLLARSRELRDLLHRLFTRGADGDLPDGSDLGALEEFLAASDQKLTLAAGAPGRISWQWSRRADAPLTEVPPMELGAAATARIIGAIASSAADLLTSDELERVKVCDAHDCGWFFVDVSRNKSRRWCDMAGCGNRDKARRYRERRG